MSSELAKPCNDAVAIPNRALTQQETERYWGVDRRSLVDCGMRHDGYVRSVEQRDAALSGVKK